MKTRITLKILLPIFTVLSLSACNHAAQNSKAYTAAFSNEQPAKVLKNSDHEFLIDAYMHEHFVVQIATEAKYRSTASETVALANQMIKNADETKNKLTGVADEYQLDLLSDMTLKQKEIWKELVKQKGWDFDKHFSTTAAELFKVTKDLYADDERQLQNETLQQVADERLALLPQQLELAGIQKDKVIARTTVVSKDILAKENITKSEAK